MIRAVIGGVLLSFAMIGSAASTAVEAVDALAMSLGTPVRAAVAHSSMAPRGPVPVDRLLRERTAAVPMPAIPTGRLKVRRLDGSLLLDVEPFDEHGSPRPDVFAEIARAFAPKSGHVQEIHPRLVELLMTLSAAFDGRPLSLVSGSREPGAGTKESSYHVRGMAADVAIIGVKVRDLRKAAIRLGAWGVGSYPSFVHIDARNDLPYCWSGGRGYSWRISCRILER